MKKFFRKITSATKPPDRDYEPLHVLLASLLVMFACGCAHCSMQNPVDMEISHAASVRDSDLSPYLTISLLLDKLKVGMSEPEVSEVLSRGFTRTTTNDFVHQYPFQEILPKELGSAVVSEWKTQKREHNGWPQIVFVVFENVTKTRLKDAFWFNDGGVRPLVDGTYNHNLHSIKAGDSVEDVYRLLGKQQAEYFRDEHGKWKVRFVYCGYPGRFFIIEADAGNGRVIYAADGTI